ncbi:MAG TPA: ABC transporter ATP-binding protein [Gemmataceae bacterium]|nr:ABC transporter ATP-binding protein [Gemmataceae bacterium]
MPPAIDCQRLGKCYRVTTADTNAVCGYRTLRDEVVAWVTMPLHRLRRGARAARASEFWALRDLSFAVKPAEVVGVVGRNGAGKSTLLKVLSRITKPTAGRVALRGRVGSLLEVGTGFHPELTGRENIYLNGAVLGMRRREIAHKFDGIVEFAEIGPFLETPVKRYSSGMYVRLAFAVAAHMEPEILIVDEVLAVGDMAFQRKCMGRMREVGQSGCTVLFVSHNMAAIESLCTRALLLDGGRLVHEGDVADVVRQYRRLVLGPSGDGIAQLADRSDSGRRQRIFRSVTLLDSEGAPTNFVPLGGLFHARITLDAQTTIAFPAITIGIDDTTGQRLLSLVTPLARTVVERVAGRCDVECRVESFPLAPGEYWLKLGLAAADVPLDDVERALHFSVLNGDAFGEGRGIHRGLCVAPSTWSVRDRTEHSPRKETACRTAVCSS